MTVIKKLVKESNAVGNRLEAVIIQRGNGSYAIDYYVNNSFKNQQIFEGVDISKVEFHAQSWLSDVRELNG